MRSSLQQTLSVVEGADSAAYNALAYGPAHRVPAELRTYYDRMRTLIPSLVDAAAGARRTAERSMGMCNACQLPLSGECATVAPNTSYHRHCIRCTVCMTPITNGYYVDRATTRVHCTVHPPASAFGNI